MRLSLAAFSTSLRRSAMPLFAAIAFLLLWEALVVLFSVRPILLPAPHLIIAEITEFPLWFLENSFYTLGITLSGFLVAAILGIAFAIAIVESPAFERMIFPLFVALNSVPKVAIAPLFIIWLGTGAEPKIAITTLIAVFAIVIDTALGLRSVAPDIIDLAKVLRGGRLRILWRIKLPCALPSLFAGLKVAMSLALVGAIVGEFVSSQKGLGYIILSAQGNFDTPRVFAAISILAVIGLGLMGLLNMLEKMALPWRRGRGGAHG